MLTRILKTLTLSLMLLTTLSSSSFADFYVIPIVKKMKNVVTVAKSGGQFSDIQTALNSITDANSTNPYLLYIGPGIYEITTPIQMKSYVTISGSGKDVTILKGAIGGDSMDATVATIVGANSSTLTNLYVTNSAAGTYVVALYNEGTYKFNVENIKVYTNGRFAYGIYNKQTSPIISNVAISTVGGDGSYGIYNISSASPTIDNVSISASGKNCASYGIRNSNSSPTINNARIEAFGYTLARGIYNYNADNTTITNSTIIGKGGSDNHYAVVSEYSYPLTIRHSILEGETHAMKGGKVSLSTIIGGGENSASCTLCVDDSGSAVGADCN